MRKSFTDKYNRFYFVGVGGVSMSALARYLLSIGKTVAGSDVCESVYTEELINLGAKVEIGAERGSVAGYEAVIYTDAIRDTDFQLVEARVLKLKILSRGQFLYEVSREFEKIIAVSGCHGKTTCTAMLAHIFDCAGKKFTAHIGGRDKKFTNFYSSGRQYFITEACEYKKNFLLLKPDISVVLNTDPDHLECYGSVANLMSAYRRFAEYAEIAVTLYKNLTVQGGITFGYDLGADYYAKNIKGAKGKYSFTVYEGAGKLGTVTLSVFGKHNVYNALAAIAVARISGIPFGDVKRGLAEFKGVERRFDYIGNFNGAECIADYAHHPEEIRETLRSVRRICEGKLYVVFQPHTYSRTKNLFKRFVKVLAMQTDLLIYKTYAAREYYDDAGSALTLSQHIKRACYGDEAGDIVDFISSAQRGDVILFLGAGDIYEIAKSVIAQNEDGF